jgi:hypothetical protein
VPAEADAIRDAAHRVLVGTPLYTIARELDAASLRPPAGGRWARDQPPRSSPVGGRPATRARGRQDRSRDVAAVLDLETV